MLLKKYLLLLLSLITFIKISSSNINDILWKDVQELSLGGLAFFPQDNTREMPYDRLPLSAKYQIPEGVWNQSIESASIYVEFITDASTIYINFDICNSDLSMWHMDAAGVSSVDLLAYDIETSMYRWVTTFGTHSNLTFPNNIDMLVENLVFNAPTLYRINFPLYNRVNSMLIGVPSNTTTFTKNTKYLNKNKNIIYYGTSIAQGACASIPSSAYINQLDASNLNFNFFNFGFSGNGKMDLSVMNYLNQIQDIDMMIIDCLPNMNYSEIENNTIPLVQSIRKTHKINIPIILVESTIYGFEWYDKTFKSNQQKKRDTLKVQYKKLLQDGYSNIYYIEGSDIIKPEDVLTSITKIDGTHPNDLGMHLYFTFWNNYLNNFNW